MGEIPLVSFFMGEITLIILPGEITIITWITYRINSLMLKITQINKTGFVINYAFAIHSILWILN